MDQTPLSFPTSPATDRFDMYQAVHKGLRAFMADTLARVGSTDYTDPQERHDTAAQVRTLLHVCAEHVVHENTFLHAPLERRAPGCTARCAQEHLDHQARLRELGEAVDAAQGMEDAGESAQAGAWRELYHALSSFVAENLEHMLHEERVLNEALWAHFSDAELVAIHDALLASIPPDEMALHFRWILPHVSHPQRVGMLQGMRQGMPADVFASQLDMARPLLDARSWRKLQTAFRPEAACQAQALAG